MSAQSPSGAAPLTSPAAPDAEIDPAAAVTTPAFRFVVLGLPVQQGSKNCRCVNGHGQLYEEHANELRRWRKVVAREARAAFVEFGHTAALDGPLQLTAEFRFPMPASRRAIEKSTGRIWKLSAPDLDKLVRALGDSLTDAKVIHDDARVVRQVVEKTEVHQLWTGVDVTVEQLWSAP